MRKSNGDIRSYFDQGVDNGLCFDLIFLNQNIVWYLIKVYLRVCASNFVTREWKLFK
jgi:hypothetical protein